MNRLYVDKLAIHRVYAQSTLQRVLFSEFEARMSSEARPFPCLFGVAGYQQNQLRYLFLDPYKFEILGEQLAMFLDEARTFGPNTSFVVFTRPKPVQTLDAYRRKFWLTLDQLARVDKTPWPSQIPEQLDRARIGNSASTANQFSSSAIRARMLLARVDVQPPSC